MQPILLMLNFHSVASPFKKKNEMKQKNTGFTYPLHQGSLQLNSAPHKDRKKWIQVFQKVNFIGANFRFQYT